MKNDNKTIWGLILIIGGMLGVSVEDLPDVYQYLGVATTSQVEQIDERLKLVEDTVLNNLQTIDKRLEQMEGNPVTDSRFDELSERLNRIEEWRRPREILTP